MNIFLTFWSYLFLSLSLIFVSALNNLFRAVIHLHFWQIITFHSPSTIPWKCYAYLNLILIMPFWIYYSLVLFKLTYYVTRALDGLSVHNDLFVLCNLEFLFQSSFSPLSYYLLLVISFSLYIWTVADKTS